LEVGLFHLKVVSSVGGIAAYQGWIQNKVQRLSLKIIIKFYHWDLGDKASKCTGVKQSAKALCPLFCVATDCT